MSYRKGRRYEEELARILRGVLSDAGWQVQRMPLSRRFMNTGDDILLHGHGLGLAISVKFGDQVPSWLYRRSFFRCGRFVVGPLEMLWLDGPWTEPHLLPPLREDVPLFVTRELERADLLCARRKRMEWRVAVSTEDAAQLLPLVKEG